MQKKKIVCGYGEKQKHDVKEVREYILLNPKQLQHFIKTPINYRPSNMELPMKKRDISDETHLTNKNPLNLFKMMKHINLIDII